MAVIVSFVIPAGLGYSSAIGMVQAREDIALDGTTTRTVQPGEMVVVGNGEAAMVAVAFGTTPDPDALVATDDTSAGVAVPAGGMGFPLHPKTGDKISAKAL